MPRRKPAPKTPQQALSPNPIITDKNGIQKTNRSERIQTILRTQQVATWLLDGKPYTQVMRDAAQEWGISERGAEKYIQKAREQIEAVSASEIRAATSLSIYRLTSLYEETLQTGDHKTALDVVKTLNRMLGLNAPDKIETSTVDNWDALSLTEQFAAIEKRLLNAQSKRPDPN
jgi:vacuolar-type H+-ATPase subunit I/STV1